MSGGHFDYLQYRISEIVDSIDQAVRNNNKSDFTDEYGDVIHTYNFSEGTIKEFKVGIDLLRRAQIYAQRIDWLLSGDEDEESFHERLKEDLKYE